MPKMFLVTIVLLLSSFITISFGVSFISLMVGSNVSPLSSRYKELKGNLVQYRDGDVLIGGLMRVHRRGEGDQCDDVLEDGIQAVETFNLMIDEVNKDPSVLPGIKLGTVMIDTCDIDTHTAARVVDVFLPLFYTGNGKRDGDKPPLFAGVVGAMSSAVSKQAASLLQIFHIPQISPWSTNPDLSNKERFPYFFRTIPSDAFQAGAMLDYIKQQGWNYISVVYEDDFYGIFGYREIEAMAHPRGICIAEALTIPRNPSEADYSEIVENLVKKKRATAVVVFTKRLDAENLIIASDRNPKAKGYFKWVGSDGWSGQLPTRNNNEYLESLHGSVGFIPSNIIIPNLLSYMANQTLGQHLDTIGNFSRNPWFPEFLSKSVSCSLTGSNSTMRQCNSSDSIDPRKHPTFGKMQKVADAVLAMVYSLDHVQKTMCSNISGVCEDMKNMAGTDQLAEKIYGVLRTVNFTSVKGDSFMFDKNQDGPAVYDIKIYDKDFTSEDDSLLEKWKTEAISSNGSIKWLSSSSYSDNITSTCSDLCKENQAKIIESSTCCWICQTCLEHQFVENGTKCVDCGKGFVPTLDRTGCAANVVQHVNFTDVYGIVSISAAAFGVILTCFMAAVFFKYRDTAIVKAFGKESAVFILIGALLCYGNGMFLSARPTDSLCIISRLLFGFGPTFMYSAIITKTIRVLIIFRAKKILSQQVKKFLLPQYQVLVIFIFILLQIFVLFAWFLLTPPQAVVVHPSREESFLVCNDTYGLLVLLGLAYPFLLILVCTVLATINRNVPVGFKETQYIGFTMYATCIVWLAFVPIFATNASNFRVKIVTLSICLSLSAVIVLLCLFGFRCFIILFKPSENTRKSMMSTKASSGGMNMTGTNKNEEPPSTNQRSARDRNAVSTTTVNAVEVPDVKESSN